MLSQDEEDFFKEDATEVLPGKLYHWSDWNIVIAKDNLYLWNEAAVLAFDRCSNGWFRFLLDGNISIMYPDGDPMKESDVLRRKTLEELQAVLRNQVKTGPPSQPILSAPGATHLVFRNWSLFCKKEGEISIHNSCTPKQAITLKEDLSGFIFVTVFGSKNLFTAETSLGPEFAVRWAKKKGKCFNAKSKLADLKQKENVTKPKIGKCSYCKTTLNEDILLFHEKDCVYQPTNCTDCSATILLKDADNHCCKLAEEFNKVLETDLLSKNLKDLFINENCWDTVLQVGDKKFKVHRGILSARSTVFSAMFQHDTSEKQTGIVNIPDCDPDSFKKFLEYIYSGKLENISSDCALHLYAISDKYNVQELKSFCIKYLIHNITSENICEVVILADAYDETELFSAIQGYFNKNFKAIVITSDWENLMKKNFRLANKLLIEKSKAE